MLLKKYFGDRAFYKMVLSVALPIILQNGITNLVGMLDNVMIGSMGTEAMSGVSIVNQYIFIFYLTVFGAISAAGIFTSQYFGANNSDGIRHTFRFKFLVSLIAGILGVIAFAVFQDFLIGLFLHETESSGDLALTLAYGKEYLAVMLIGLIPYSLSQVYSSTLRETEQTVFPMLAGASAVIINVILNAVLIFGLLGFPALGVTGAAIATVISRYAELLILAVKAHTDRKNCPFMKNALSSLSIPKGLLVTITLKGLPLMANEFFWALAMTLKNQCFSTRGLDAVAAQNISSTVFNLLNVVYMALGASVAIVIGKLLGAGKLDEARDTDRKMITFSVLASVGMALIMISLSQAYPLIYNTTDSVRNLASYMLIISAIATPFAAFANAAYFTLRSGGHVMITLLFDSVFMWALVMPVSFGLAYFTGIGIHALFAICQLLEIVKVIFGIILLKRGSWVRQLVGKEESKAEAKI